MKKRLKKKLILKKTTLANLNDEGMNRIYGGTGGTYTCSPETRRETCGTAPRACGPGTVAITCGCNTLTDC
jgi:hypothetical protein